jgi:predicted Na+-dependent transporter
MQILLVLSAMIAGLSYSYFGGGFIFSPSICLFAGIFLIAPVLFKFHFSDFKLVLEHKMLIFKNLSMNFILLPIVAIAIGYLTGDFGIAGGLFLLSLLSGGGMVMHWIKTSGANPKLGFVVFFINIALIALSFKVFDIFSHNPMILDIYGVKDIETSLGIPAFGVFMKLIIIPLLFSRIILRFAPTFPKFVEENKKFISNFALTAIVFYLFAISTSAQILQLEPILIIKAFIAVVLFYIINYIISTIMYKNDKNEIAVFWHSIMRFITISLVLATFAVSIFGNSFLLPIMIAYVIQIPFASKIAQIKSKSLQ